MPVLLVSLKLTLTHFHPYDSMSRLLINVHIFCMLSDFCWLTDQAVIKFQLFKENEQLKEELKKETYKRKKLKERFLELQDLVNDESVVLVKEVGAKTLSIFGMEFRLSAFFPF